MSKYLARNKTALALILFSFTFLVLPRPIYAAVSCIIGNEPRPEQLFCPFLRVINLLILMGGIVLAAMIAFGAIKLGTSLGDPKGLQSAQKTWLYAFIGFGVAVGAAAIYMIIARTFGLTAPSSSGLDDLIMDNWSSYIYDVFKIE